MSEAGKENIQVQTVLQAHIMFQEEVYKSKSNGRINTVFILGGYH